MAAEHAGAATVDALERTCPCWWGSTTTPSLTGSLLAHVWARPDKGWLLAFTIA